MERTHALELMSTLKLYGMRSAYDEVMGMASNGSTNRRASSVISCSRKSLRSRPVHSLPAQHSQAATRQGHRRLRLRRHARQ